MRPTLRLTDCKRCWRCRSLLWGFPIEYGRIDLSRFRLSKFFYWTLVLAMFTGIMMWIGQAFGVKLHLHSFASVYDIREDHAEIAEGHSRVLIYLMIWQANILGPLMIAYAWSKRQPVFAVAGLFRAGVGVLRIGLQTIILAIPFVCFVLLLSRLRRPGAMMLVLAGGLLALVVACSALDTINEGVDYSTLFVRRNVAHAGPTNLLVLRLLRRSAEGDAIAQHSRKVSGIPL